MYKIYYNLYIMTTTIIEKLKELRSQTWVSQEDIANYLWISRLTYMSIESGKREVKDNELKLIAEFFERPVSYFVWTEIKENKEDPNYKLKQLILYISEKTQHIPSFWKTVLNKLLYFSDFNYYEWAFKTITWVDYRKLPYGPVPEKITEVLEEMQKEWLIAISETTYHNYTQQKIIPLVVANTDFLDEIDKQNRKITKYKDLPTPKNIIDDVLNKFKHHKASEISEWSHLDKPYKSAKNIWEKLRPWLVFYRSESFVVNPNNLEHAI